MAIYFSGLETRGEEVEPEQYNRLIDRLQAALKKLEQRVQKAEKESKD